MAIILNTYNYSKFKGKPGGFKKEAEKMTQERFNKIESMEIVPVNKSNLNYYTIDTSVCELIPN